MTTEPPEELWPPLWARKVGFLTGIGLGVYEAVIEHSAHLFVYGFAWILTGLPLARGAAKLLELLSGAFGKKP